MIFTTTNNVDGYRISQYKGIVFGEIITGIDFVKDFKAGLTNFFGGRSDSYEQELVNTRNDALREMQARAESMGCNAVIGIKFDYELLGAANNMMMVTCSGTAVVIQSA